MFAAGTLLALLSFSTVLKAIEGAEIQKLQGKWSIVAMEVGEAKHTFPEEKNKDFIVVIRGNRWLWPEDAKEDDMAFKLNLAAKPKQIDFSFTKWGSFSSAVKGCPVTFLGIYSLEGDTLKVCFDMPFNVHGVGGPAIRPRKFTGKPDLWFQTMKRLTD